MKPYFGYIRVSTPKQGRGVSLEEQRAAILAFAERRGLRIAQWFVETETAARQGRPEYGKLILGLKTGKAAGVVIHKIDRGARNMKDWANLGELIDAGVDVQFAHESLDLRSRGGRLAADIQAVVAADYIRNLRDEVFKGFYGRLKQGVYPLPAPVGYLDRGAGMPKEIDPVMGPLVQYAFERYASGKVSLDSLQQELAARGLKTHRSAALSRNGLAGMLHNPFYIGIIRIYRRDESFQGAHTPLITKALFDRVQDAMAGRVSPKAKRHDFLYRGLILHEPCARHLTGERIKGRHVYYRCHGPGCKGTALREGDIDHAITAAISRLVLTPVEMGDFRDLVEEARKSGQADSASDAVSLDLRIAGCSARIARLTDAYLDGTISKEAHDERMARLLGERRDLQDRLAGLNGEAEWVKACKKFELNNNLLLRYKILSGDEKRKLLSILSSNFSCVEKKPVITLRFPYDKIAESDLSPAVGCFGPMFERRNKLTRCQVLQGIVRIFREHNYDSASRPLSFPRPKRVESPQERNLRYQRRPIGIFGKAPSRRKAGEPFGEGDTGQGGTERSSAA